MNDTAGIFRDGDLPPNVVLGARTLVTGGKAFRSFRANSDDALVIGSDCTLDGVSFAVGKEGKLRIGDACHFSGCILLCEMEVTIGSFVSLGWNVSIADTDFHPIDPAMRIEDAIACSNISNGRKRPEIIKKPVIIEDDVYVGPNVTILKGTRIGAGSWIEPGALVTHDVPPRSRVIGNPARIVGEV